MRFLFRVNNPEFGIMHLNPADPQESEVDPARILPMVPESVPSDFLRQKGLKKGDPIRIRFDEQNRIIRLEREDGEVLWSMT